MYLTIIIMPLIASIISGFFGRKIGVKGSHIITCSLIIFTAILAILAFIETGLNNSPVSLHLFRWIDSESLNVFIGFNLDSLTVSMLIPVLIVSSLVHLYSIGYMSHDPHNQRFFSYLSLFTFMMIILVTANNYLLMFVGWEGVGICSYLLVSFWFTRIAANQSSISAILTNRVGDCFLTIGMFAILWSLGNLDYATVFSLAPFINENIITFIGICLLIGAMAKSSQIGLHVWLPMAMEGPTPVSALIHAATMVTAGVYLLIRSSPLIEYSSTVLLLCLWLGAITTVFSSLIGLFQQDIKKVIAYSTMSQLGIMVIAVGLSSYNIALFHLVNHAFYKALLFLGAGAVIHAVADNQDFRKYGSLKQFLPLSYSVMFIASLSLVAFPFMTGFYSKDFILESSYGGFYLSSIVVYYIATIGAMFTTLYSIKTLYLTFITNPNGALVDYKNVHEGNVYMSLPLVVLALFSIFFGFVTKDMFIGLGSDLFTDNSIFIHPTNEIMLNTEFAVPTLYKLLPLIFTISLSIISGLISEYLFKSLINFKFSRFGYNIFSFFNLRFLIELIYNKYITETVLKLGGQTTKVLDKGAIELIGPYGLERALIIVSKKISLLDTGVVTTYALYILVGGLAYISISYMSLFSNPSLILLILLAVSVVVVNRTYKDYIIHKSYNINSFVMYDLVVLINISVYNYIKNFNFIYLMKSFIKFRFKSIVYALILILPLQLYLHITTGRLDINLELLWIISSYIVLGTICYRILYLPWKHTTLIPFAVRFILNCSIVSFVIITILLLFNSLNIDNLSLGIILPVLWEDCLIFIKGDNGEGGSSEGGSDSKGPNPQIPDPKEPEILGVASSKVASSEKANSEEYNSDQTNPEGVDSNKPNSSGVYSNEDSDGEESSHDSEWGNSTLPDSYGEKSDRPDTKSPKSEKSEDSYHSVGWLVDQYGEDLKSADDELAIRQRTIINKMIAKGESRGQDVTKLQEFLEEDRPEETLRTDSEVEDEKEIYKQKLLDSRKIIDTKPSFSSKGVKPEDIPMQSIEKDPSKSSKEESLDAGKDPSNKRAREESPDNGEGPSNKRAREESPDNGEGPSNRKVR